MAACAHVWGEEQAGKKRGNAGDKSTLVGTQTAMLSKVATAQGATCQRCQAWCGTLGNEPDVPRYIWHTLLWLREVRRCLRDDGVAWVIIADSFAGSASHAHEGLAALGAQYRGGGHKQSALDKPAKETHGYPQGSLLGIPQQVMLAAMADGWVVRNDVIWAKASPMPESVAGWRHQQPPCSCVAERREAAAEHYQATTGVKHSTAYAYIPHGATIGDKIVPNPDCPTCGGTGRLATEVLRKGSWRHTRATETILMLTKGMGYFANGEAVREALADTHAQRTTSHYDTAERYGARNGGNGGLDVLANRMREGSHAGRNPRNVVSPSAAPFAGAHFATFPPALIEPLIRATCPERCCPTCGMGWAPCISSEGGRDWHNDRMKDNGFPGAINGAAGYKRGQSHEALNNTQRHTIHGLRPSCAHYCTCDPPAPWDTLLLEPPVCPTCGKLPLRFHTPSRCLDPFSGASTTLLTARALGRNGVGVELSLPYIQLSRERLGLTALARWEGTPAPPTAEQHYGDLPLFATEEVP
jgi:DNA modification methylase